MGVIDVDDMNEYHKLVKKYNFLSEVFRVKTYKGIHLYFNYDPTIKTTTNAFMNYKNIEYEMIRVFVYVLQPHIN